MPERFSPAAATRKAARRNRRGLRWTIALIVALLLIYVASPYYAVWRFVGALKSGDTVGIATRVDFVEVRAAMKKQLRDHFFPETPDQKRAKKNRLTSIVAQLGPGLVDQLVDAYLTPDGLSALIANPKINSIGDRPPSASGTANANSGLGPNSDWSKVRYAFFTGPTDFLVNLNGTKVRFGFDAAGWRVHRVELALGEPVRK